MATRFGDVILVLFAMVMAQSCTVQKRVHMPGWYVSTHIFENGKSTNNSRSAEQLELIAIETNVEIVNAESDSGPQMNEVMQDSEKILQSTIERPISARIRDSQPKAIVSKFTKGMPISQTNKAKSKVAPSAEKEKSKEFLPKLWGGFLGVLLALVALIPLFLVSFLLFDGDYEEEYEFYLSSQDSPFLRSFKQAFNVVLKTGLTMLFIAGLILVVGTFFSLLYLEFGVAGVIVGVLFLFVIMWLFAKGLEKLLEFLFPGNSWS